MEYPNKTFLLNHTNESEFGKKQHIVLVVAENRDVACDYLKEKLGFKGVPNDLVWLMDTNHTTIYDQTGNKPLPIQAKIIYNTTIKL
jgi:hypothetical protein